MGIEAKRSPAKLVLNLLPRIRILSNGPNFLKEAFTHNRNSKHSTAADQACKSGQTQGVRMSDHSLTLAAGELVTPASLPVEGDNLEHKREETIACVLIGHKRDETKACVS